MEPDGTCATVLICLVEFLTIMYITINVFIATIAMACIGNQSNQTGNRN